MNIAIVNIISFTHPHAESLFAEGLWGFPDDKLKNNKRNWEKLNVGDNVLLYGEYKGIKGIWFLCNLKEKREYHEPIKYWNKNPTGYPWQIKLVPVFPLNKFDKKLLNEVVPLTKDDLKSLGINIFKQKYDRWSVRVYDTNNQQYPLISKAIEIFKNINPKKVPIDLRKIFKDLIKSEESINIGLRHLEALISIHLIAGKNAIITGTPGSGKTTLSENICKTLGLESSVITGNPEWTPFDTIGGRDINGIFRPGLVTNSIIDCWRSLKNKGVPAFLIIDEINRANVDLALGGLFTLLDVKHRENPLIESTENLGDAFKDVLIKGNLYVPYSFRIIATMNSYDKALLFKLGYALLRRFAVVDMRRNFKFEQNPQDWIEKVKDFIKKGKSCDLEKSVNLDMIDKELRNLSRREFNDYALIDGYLQTTIGNDGVRGILGRLAKNLGLDSQDILSLIYKMVCTINERLSNYEIEITEAPVADTIKFIAVSALLDENWASQHLATLLDEALSSYVAPQLDILADKVRAENLKLLPLKEERSLKEKLDDLSDMMKNLELIKFSDRLSKLARGESIL
jgi:hypothetical protein